jgi:phosphoribosylglycinamide formyltransferase-1
MLTRIAVLVSGGGTNLQALIDAQKGGALRSGEIVLVVSNRAGVFALRRAEENGIPARVVEKKSGGQEDFEKELGALLEEFGVELIVLAGFLSILSAGFTARWPRRILNVHPSLIPSFCGRGFFGLKVHEAALAAGVKVTGATVHFVNEIPDGGEILLQRAVEVEVGDTPQTLQQRVMREAEWQLLPAAAEMIAAEIRKEREHQ